MDEYIIPRLSTIPLKTRPLGNHALSLSCDAELAVIADDSVHVLLPEFPTPDDIVPGAAAAAAVAAAAANGAAIDAGGRGGGKAASHPKQYHNFRGQFMAIRKPDPRINHRLFADAGCPMDLTFDNDEEPYFGVGGGVPTAFGSSLNQTVAVRWSPGGLGHNLRPVLAVHLTNGSVLVYGEDPELVEDISSRKRTFKSWRILWGVGGVLPLPDLEKPDCANLPKDKITSVAWAKEIGRGRALMAYMTDREEIVVISVQYSLIEGNDFPSWTVKEVSRFADIGPHPKQDWTNPDFVPHGTPNALAWSPWLTSGNTMTAALAHTARSYIGFRRITIPTDWARDTEVDISVEDTDYSGICIGTVVNSAVTFEDAIWARGNQKICLGALVTPFAVKTFETDLAAPPVTSRPSHSSDACGTSYPAPLDGDDAHNPVSGIYMHPPDTTSPTDIPSFTLVRLAATSKTSNYYQRNTPRSHPPPPRPQWLDHVRSTVAMSIPRAMASRDADSDVSANEGDSSDDDFDMPDDAGEQVRPWRMHLYGLAASPAAAGMTAVLLAQQSTLGPERRFKTKLAFGWRPRRTDENQAEEEADADDDVDPDIVMDPALRSIGAEPVETDMHLDPGFRSNTSTEARLWEWMYGGGEPVPFSVSLPDVMPGWQTLRARFAHAIETQKCLFCAKPLIDTGRQSVCEQKHSFATCATTGLAIKAPGISRICGICGMRTLCEANILEAAETHGTLVSPDEAAVEQCGGCAGKFIA